MRVKDFNNTWCERTKKTEEYFRTHGDLICSTNGFFYFDKLGCPHLGYKEDTKKDKDQIHLINNEFYYVNQPETVTPKELEDYAEAKHDINNPDYEKLYHETVEKYFNLALKYNDLADKYIDSILKESN